MMRALSGTPLAMGSQIPEPLQHCLDALGLLCEKAPGLLEAQVLVFICHVLISSVTQIFDHISYLFESII